MLQDERTMDSAVWTIGHSTRPLDAFIWLLAEYRLEAVADVRRFPGSRRQPQYAQAALHATRAAHGIGYRWIPALGGRRRPLRDSPNIAWRNASFRLPASSPPDTPRATCRAENAAAGSVSRSRAASS
jgi:hypothetical protein